VRAKTHETEMPFQYEISAINGLRLISLMGRFKEKEQSEELIAAFEEMLSKGKNSILLELSSLEYVNSSGLNLLIGMLTRAINVGGELAICRVSDKVRQLLVMTRLDLIFKIYGSVENASEHFTFK
jgi:anti-sigma B factor antagonist